MKKFVLVTTLLMAGLTASAQYGKGKTSMLVHFGFGASSVSNVGKENLNNVSLDNEWKYSFQWGTDFEYMITDRFSAALGLKYVNQGVAWEDYKFGAEKIKDIEMDLNYLAFPLTFRYYIYKGLAIRSGVQVGILTSAENCFTLDTSDDDGHDMLVHTSINTRKDLEKIDLSVPVSISYEFNNHFVIDATYNIGLTKVNKYGDKKLKNQSFLINLGYKFDL